MVLGCTFSSHFPRFSAMYYAFFGASIFSTIITYIFSHNPGLLLKPKVLRSSISEHFQSFNHPSFRAFQANYLLVYLLAVAADWVQGPYVYALYSHYGFEKTNIARLYIAGFASSAIFGTFVASVADKYGRRNNALFYCLLYSLSCLTKHSSKFSILLFGRLLGGIAYSILFSAFEAWIVYEHHGRLFDTSLLAATFARAQFGNGVVAIVSGQIAGQFADRYGKVAPFDVSIMVLLVLAIVISTTWVENYGDVNQSLRGGLTTAWKSLMADEKIILLGISQSAFEGALYTFTFVWTPALQTAEGQVGEIPHGTIFSTFMAATMMGSNLFSFCQRRIKVEVIMRNVFFVGMLVFVSTTLSQRIEVVYCGFLVFEVLCGVYFPGMATMRAPYIPEENRSALLTFFRIPLNFIVVVALFEDMEVNNVYAFCAFLMAIAFISQQRLISITRSVPEAMDLEKAFLEVHKPEEF